MTNTHLVLGIKVIQQGHWATHAVSCGKLIDPILKRLLIFLIKKKTEQYGRKYLSSFPNRNIGNLVNIRKLTCLIVTQL